MKEWAPQAEARNALFYSLRFLFEVLLQTERSHSTRSYFSDYKHSVGDDCVLNRVWVVCQLPIDNSDSSLGL